jgi:hypothetical protein
MSPAERIKKECMNKIVSPAKTIGLATGAFVVGAMVDNHSLIPQTAVLGGYALTALSLLKKQKEKTTARNFLLGSLTFAIDSAVMGLPAIILTSGILLKNMLSVRKHQKEAGAVSENQAALEKIMAEIAKLPPEMQKAAFANMQSQNLDQGPKRAKPEPTRAKTPEQAASFKM